MSVPGLVYASSSLTSPLSPSTSSFNKWYNEVHIPDVLSLHGTSSAFRYANADPTATPQFLALYPLADLATPSSEELKAVPITHEIFPAPSHNASDVVEFRSRLYEHIQSYEPEDQPGPGDLLFAAAITPATGADDDLDRWYREEHLALLAACLGYRRTRRYKLLPLPGGEEAPEYVAFHEFDGEALPMEQLGKTAETEWARRCLGGAQTVETTVWKLLGGFGDQETVI